MRALIAALLLLAAPARAAEIAVALTDTLVEVDSGFAGARIVLFGAVTGVDIAPGETPDIIAIVRGPDMMFRVRPIERRRFIWRAGRATVFPQAPGFFATASTRAVDEIVSDALRRELRLTPDTLDLAPSRGAARPEITEALFSAARRSGRFRETVGSIDFKKDSLFAIDVELPPITPTGDYVIEVFLFRDERLVSQDRVSLAVTKVGVERHIYELAHQRPIAYGLGCVAISLFAGWLAAAAFRR